jgi:hypothetical protein
VEASFDKLRRTHLMKELYTKPVSEVNEFAQTADVITTSGTDWGQDRD